MSTHGGMSLKDILLALLVVSLWGVNFVVIRIGLDDLPPILFSALRFLFAALPLVFFVRRPQVPLHVVALFGMFQFALQFSLLFFGIKLGLPAGLASLVIQLQAFFTIGLAVWLLGERPQLMQLMGALVALGGMAVVAAHLEGQATLLGLALVIAAGLCWSCANIVNKKMGPVDALSLMAWGSLLATPPIFLVSYLAEGGSAWALAAHKFGLKSLATVLFQSYANTLLGFGIWSMLMRKYATATIAPFSLLVPVAGMLSAALFLGEALQGWKITAGLMVLGGLVLNQFGGRLWQFFRAKAGGVM